MDLAVNIPITSASVRLVVVLMGSPINPEHVFRGATTATAHIHNKFRVFHGFPYSFRDG